MNIVVVGAGAVGSFLAATLSIAGHDTALVGRRAVPPDRAASLVLTDDAGSRTVRVRRTGELGTAGMTPDLVVLAVKQFDLPAVVAGIAGWPAVPVLTVQNGVGAEACVDDARGGVLLAGSLTTAVEATDDGVRRLRAGGIGLATVTGDGEALAASLARDLDAAGLRAVVVADAAAMKWSKLIANLVGNATSALLDLDPAAIYRDPALYHVERRQLTEALAVMRAMGLHPVGLPGANVPLLVRGVGLPEGIGRHLVARAIGGARGGKSPSLRLHLRGGGSGPTEVRWLNGAVVDAGGRVGVATPVNAALTELVEQASVDPAVAADLRGRADRLLAAIEARERAG